MRPFSAARPPFPLASFHSRLTSPTAADSTSSPAFLTHTLRRFSSSWRVLEATPGRDVPSATHPLASHPWAPLSSLTHGCPRPLCLRSASCRSTSNSVRQKLTLAETADSPPLPVFYLLLFTSKCQISVFFLTFKNLWLSSFYPEWLDDIFVKAPPPKCTVTHYRWVSLSFSQQFNSVISCL